jgi:hypothetical protein
MSALKNELGSVGATYFIRQFASGRGDYTAERDQLLQGTTLDEIIKNVRAIEKGSKATKQRKVAALSTQRKAQAKKGQPKH